MRKFDYRKLKDALWSSEIVGYISQIRLMQGRQDSYLHTAQTARRGKDNAEKPR